MNCPYCNTMLPENSAFCSNCGANLTQGPQIQETQPPMYATATPVAPVVPEKQENMLTGIVGALLGAAIGAGAIILLGQLGYIASISGFILAVCTLKGYELLGGKLSAKGLIISLVLLLVTPYIADRLDWTILIMKEFSNEGVTFGQAFSAVPALIEEGAIVQSEYIKNLLMLYIFTILGAFSTFKGFFKKAKN